jgi:hypothetical protein
MQELAAVLELCSSTLHQKDAELRTHEFHRERDSRRPRTDDAHVGFKGFIVGYGTGIDEH